jgi:polyphosphate:AMP phosphotransferase
MFQTAELGQKVPREDFDRLASKIRLDLLSLQQELRNADFPVIVVFAGVDGAGKGETVNLINEWMDPRWILTCAYGDPSDEENERPLFWRYWRDLPPKGHIGLFLSCWYSQPVLDHVHEVSTPDVFYRQLDHIMAFEKMLADDGALILKFWMHLGKKAQKQRLKTLEADPLQSWRVTKADWRNYRLYDRFIDVAEQTLSRTGTGPAPWTIVEGEDPPYRSLAVLSALADGIRRHLAARAAMHATVEDPPPQPWQNEQPRPMTVLDKLDMTLALEKMDYVQKLREARAELALMVQRARESGVSTVLVFEGWDAAGKGGTIRRLTAGLDARSWRVLPFAAPTDEERSHHYLWRFWRNLQRAGRLMIFDRSWYGRVLVERVEGYARPEEWMRAYAEINDFEEELVDHGMVLVKFWMHITKDEQLRRFEERKDTPYKTWKLTDEDWRNREKWDEYQIAVNDMVERTSTRHAPWVLVEANDKNYARVKVIRTVCEKLEQRLGKVLVRR